MDTTKLIEEIKDFRSNGYSLSQISKHTGYSLTYIKNLNKQHNIPKGIGKPFKKECCESCGRNLKGNQTKFCSKQCGVESWYKNNGIRNTYHYQKLKGIKRKKMIVEMKGGCCEVCGYNKSLRALTFHHRDPSLKLFHLNLRDISIRSMDSIIEELNKCDLLCFNCHMELHENEEKSPQQDLNL